MQELLAKIGRFCENHVEKIVFVIVAPICGYLFFTYVIFSPNRVTYEGQTFSPGRVDSYIDEKANDLRDALAGVQRRAGQKEYASLIQGPIEPDDPVVASAFASRPAPESFLSLFEDPLSFIDVGDERLRTRVATSGRKYALPSIGSVRDVGVNHIRAAAYVPTAPLTSTVGYDQVQTRPDDIDLVTVEAKFDVAELYRQFNAYFAGSMVEQRDWRDPCLAVPKFASVQLHRQRLLDDGSWSNWTAVPRSRVEQLGELFTPIERVQDLPPGGMKVRRMQLDSKPVTMALLQPEAYQIASAEEDWFPPSIYGKFKSLQRKVDLEQRRQEREERQSQQAAATTVRRDDGRTGGAARRGGAADGGAGLYGGAGARAGAGATAGRTRTRGETTTDGRAAAAGGRGAATDPYGVGGRGEVGLREAVSTHEAYFDLADVMLTYSTDLSRRREPLLFWAFDDIAEPGHTYRYRIRLGVLNPVAGTDQLVEGDMDKRDQVILWSPFSDVTEAVTLPKRIYFFAKNVQDRTGTATVEVARYTLGYWYTEDFQVGPGDVIGREMEPPSDREEDRRAARAAERITGVGAGGAALLNPRAMDYQVAMPDDPTKPDMIDYNTGTMLVDLVEKSDLGSPPNLQPRSYYDMLYTADGAAIDHMPVSQRHWPSDLQQAYQQIVGERNKERQPFRAFSATRTGGRGGIYGGHDPYGR